MTEPAEGSPRSTGFQRPVWIGWSVAAVLMAVASVVVATGVSDRGAGVRLPPAIDIGTGITLQPNPPGPSGPGATTTEPPTVEVPPDTAQVQTSPEPSVPSPDSRTSTDRAGSGTGGQAEPGDSATTVPPEYPVVTGGSTDGQPAGGGDS